MGKPIEPGCLCVLLASKYSGMVVTVVKETIPQMPGASPGIWWEITSSHLRAVSDSLPSYKKNNWPWASHECNLRRIDDGDFNPAAEGEDNPYRQVTTWHICAPTR